MSSKPRPYIPYDVPLAEGERARLVLPQDLSTAEAERLCAVIRSLAFTDEQLAEAEAAAEWRRGSLGALIADWAAAADVIDSAPAGAVKEDGGP